MTRISESGHQPKKPTCPICGRKPDSKTAPFCSKRCADVDLAHWLKGDYAIPAVEPPDDSPGDETED
jgi:endogenous inhibitor of DNA gyrase (YacG/DUF329 family)